MVKFSKFVHSKGVCTFLYVLDIIQHGRKGLSMKKFSLVLTMLAIVLVFGLAFVSCGSDDGNNNTPGGQTPGGQTPGGTTPGGNVYTITYDINGGSGTTPPSQSVTIGTIPTLAGGSGFSKSGYAFGGWNTRPDASGDQYYIDFFIDYPFPLPGNLNLYALWNSSEGGYLTVTGIPSQYEGKYALFANGVLLPTSSSGYQTYHGHQDIIGWSEGKRPRTNNIILCQIVNGSVSLPMWWTWTVLAGRKGYERYSGNSSIYGVFEIYNVETAPDRLNNRLDNLSFTFKCSNGSATVTWDSGMR